MAREGFHFHQAYVTSNEMINLWDDPAHAGTRRELIGVIVKLRIDSVLKTQGWTLASVTFGANSDRTPQSSAGQGGG